MLRVSEPEDVEVVAGVVRVAVIVAVREAVRVGLADVLAVRHHLSLRKGRRLTMPARSQQGQLSLNCSQGWLFIKK